MPSKGDSLKEIRQLAVSYIQRADIPLEIEFNRVSDPRPWLARIFIEDDLLSYYTDGKFDDLARSGLNREQLQTRLDLACFRPAEDRTPADVSGRAYHVIGHTANTGLRSSMLPWKRSSPIAKPSGAPNHGDFDRGATHRKSLLH